MPTRQQIAQAQRRQIEEAKEVDLERLLPQLGFERTNKDGNGVRFERGNAKVKLFKGRTGQSWWKSFSGDLGDKAGNIIDMIMFVEGCDYRRACTRVREMLCLTDPADDYSRAQSSAPVIPPAPTSLVDSSGQGEPKTSPEELLKRYTEACTRWRLDQPVPSYLQSRHFNRIPRVFDGCFGVQKDGGAMPNIIFPYFRYEGGQLSTAGYERKGKDFQRYSKGGQVGFWKGRRPQSDAPLMIAEAPIDAMAYELCSADAAGARERGVQLSYLALRSGAAEQVAEHVARLAREGLTRVFMITDNDSAGLAYASEVMREIARRQKADEIRKDLTCRYIAPSRFQTDWADVLAFLSGHRDADAPPPPPPPPACSPSYEPA